MGFHNRAINATADVSPRDEPRIVADILSVNTEPEDTFGAVTDGTLQTWSLLAEILLGQNDNPSAHYSNLPINSRLCIHASPGDLFIPSDRPTQAEPPLSQLSWDNSSTAIEPLPIYFLLQYLHQNSPRRPPPTNTPPSWPIPASQHSEHIQHPSNLTAAYAHLMGQYVLPGRFLLDHRQGRKSSGLERVYEFTVETI